MKNIWEKLARPIIALAPMAGVSDLPFRLVCRKFGADIAYSEMIMVQGLARHNEKTLRLMASQDGDQPLIIQLGGNEPDLFYKSAQIIKRSGLAAGIDINLGCPAKKIAGHGSGVALLRDLDRVHEIVKATLDGAGGLPVSVKTRIQIKSHDKQKIITSLDLVAKLKDLPVAAMMIHGRSFEAPWIETVDYDFIKQVKKIFKGLVLANGGIYEPEIAKKALEITGADGLGLAHGVYGRPWLFKQIKDYLKTGSYQKLSWPEKRAVALEHAALTAKLKGPGYLVELRKQLLYYVKGLPLASNIERNWFIWRL